MRPVRRGAGGSAGRDQSNVHHTATNQTPPSSLGAASRFYIAGCWSCDNRSLFVMFTSVARLCAHSTSCHTHCLQSCPLFLAQASIAAGTYACYERARLRRSCLSSNLRSTTICVKAVSHAATIFLGPSRGGVSCCKVGTLGLWLQRCCHGRRGRQQGGPGCFSLTALRCRRLKHSRLCLGLCCLGGVYSLGGSAADRLASPVSLFMGWEEA